MKDSELSIKQEKCAHYLVGGMSMKDTADLLSVTEMTVYRWIRLKPVQSLIRELRRISIEYSIGRLQRLNDDAISCLERNLTCGNFAAEVRSASTILTKNAENLDYLDFESRIAAIEEKFNEK
jgi:transposase-like protein